MIIPTPAKRQHVWYIFNGRSYLGKIEQVRDDIHVATIRFVTQRPGRAGTVIVNLDSLEHYGKSGVEWKVKGGRKK